jgi:hypothetical protein
MSMCFGKARSRLFQAVLKKHSSKGRSQLFSSLKAQAEKGLGEDRVEMRGERYDEIRTYRRNELGVVEVVPFRELEGLIVPRPIPAGNFTVTAQHVESELQRTQEERRQRLHTPNPALMSPILPKDLTVNPETLSFYTDGVKTSAAEFARLCARVGKVEGFQVRVATSKAEVAELLKGENLCTGVVPEGGRWLEDYSDVLQDGGRLVPALFEDKKSAWATDTIYEGRQKRLTERGLKSDFELGASVNKDSWQKTGLAMGLASGRATHQAITHVEGGNILPGVTADGQGRYALVGADSFAVTRGLLEKETGRDWDEAAVINAMAADRGLKPEEIHKVEQPGSFHLDLRMMALAPGHVALNDAQRAVDMQQEWLLSDLQEVAVDLGSTDEEKAEARDQIEGLVERLRQEATSQSQYEALTERDLKAAGMTVHRVAGAFSPVQRKPYFGRSEHADQVNFFNGRPGTNDAGGTFAILMGGTPREEAAYAESLLNLEGSGLDRVHFLDPSLTEDCLDGMGGLKCLSKFDGAVELESFLRSDERTR